MKYMALVLFALVLVVAAGIVFAQDDAPADASGTADPLWYNRASLFTPAAGTLIGTMILVILTRAGITAKLVRWLVVIAFSILIAGIQSFVLAPDPDAVIRLVVALVNVVLLVFALTGTNEFGARLSGRRTDTTDHDSRWFESLF